MTAALAAVTFAFGLGTIPARAAAPPAHVAKGQWTYTTLSLRKTWQITQGSGVTVAVIDSGVVASVGDLRGQVLDGVNLSGGGADGNGQSDPGQDCDGPGGCYSHGTDLALNIAGTGRGAGFVGVAPQAKILPVKVTARSGQAASESKIAAGIRWAVDHGAQVIAVGVGGHGLCPTDVDEAGKYAYQHAVPIVIAAGDGNKVADGETGCYDSMGISADTKQFTP